MGGLTVSGMLIGLVPPLVLGALINALVARNACTMRKSILVEQRVELLAQPADPTRLHLDQLPFGANQIDHKSSDGDLDRSPGCASLALIAAYSGPSRSTPLLGIAHRLNTLAAASPSRHKHRPVPVSPEAEAIRRKRRGDRYWMRAR
jgi:hypothetical protein